MEKRNFHIVTTSFDSGEDDKNDCATFAEALIWVRQYLANGYDKARIIGEDGVVCARLERFADGTIWGRALRRYAAHFNY